MPAPCKKKAITNLDSILKSRDITLPTKVHLIKAMVFPVVMYGCESCTIKKSEHWRIDAVVLEKTLESPLDCKEIQPVHPKGNQSWVFIGKSDVEAETPIFFPASGSFQMSQLFASGGQSIAVSASTPVLPLNTQDWSPLGWTGWISLLSKELSRVFSNTTIQKHQFFGTQLSSQSYSHIHTWPTWTAY